LKIFAAAGYRCFAIDLPGCGRTGGPAVSDCEKPEVLSLVIRRLDLEVVMVVGHSMAGQYIVPLLGTDRIICVVAIALSNTNMLDESASHIATPVLVVWGERDTSLGPSSASNLKRLPNARLLKIASGSHACYLSNPSVFQSACLNFFDLVRHYSTL
uniref:AB hydrolase-1 domain-containing protein n=1 Tax=Ascaris lumbricoides TaxID=6252 RepID=A0A0M3IPV3_ASCLU